MILRPNHLNPITDIGQNSHEWDGSMSDRKVRGMEALLAALGGGILVAAAQWLFNRRWRRSEVDVNYVNIASTAWTRTLDLENRIIPLESFQSAAIPVLKKCADGDPKLAAEMRKLRLLENGGGSGEEKDE